MKTTMKRKYFASNSLKFSAIAKRIDMRKKWKIKILVVDSLMEIKRTANNLLFCIKGKY